VKISNDAFRRILDLFERYNFTVEESTPLDVQVAVDPEMLGKVFEELVTGRHESGSYYTPRQIVSFMCREALKHYLTKTAGADAAARFVDGGDAGALKNPESVLEDLRRVRVCDPACGSGAYLLGMMQELVRLRGALFVSRSVGDDSAYEIKRSIIENNLYGVDKDRFAVQIAALRLWLSLEVEAETPKPLPNLDFKIGCGDSLTAPAPSEAEKQMAFSRGVLVGEFQRLKNEFTGCREAERKARLRVEIERVRGEIALALKHEPPRPSEQKIKLARATV
jgi:type I restriction-modification system DNA methylase subunit